MRLVVFHYHDRPGGVRQVISRGLPALVVRLEKVTEVVLMIGEQTDPTWARDLALRLAGVQLRVVVHPELGYRSGLSQCLGEAARAVLEEVLAPQDTLCWAHNLSVGRNLPLLRFLPGCCGEAGARLWLHHHDWWWDGRWARWADWQAGGIHTLAEALETSLPTGPHIHHWCVNAADLPWVQQRAGNAAAWVGNPLPDLTYPDEKATASAAVWLREKSGGRRVWLAPVRALRRKNLAEAILLARQQPEPTCVITTGGPSSPAEGPAWDTLCQAAARHHWSFVPAVLSPGARTCSPPQRPGLTSHPSLPALLAAADAIVMPSLQEGFGLPYLEAAALGKPLLARALPDVTANLAALGCALPGAYPSLPISLAPSAAAAESRRRGTHWQKLSGSLPRELQGEPFFHDAAVVRDFGQLTLEGQVDYLASGGGLAAPAPEPQRPHWPQPSRVDQWAERFFQSPPEARPMPELLERSLLPEVLRRFRHWQRHPLLWP